MHPMFLPRRKARKEQQGEPQAVQPEKTINPFPYELNITDGGEFIDDGIRMTEQPLEEKVNKDPE
jgi:hypothetical protein